MGGGAMPPLYGVGTVFVDFCEVGGKFRYDAYSECYKGWQDSIGSY